MNWSDVLVVGIVCAFILVGFFSGFVLSLYRLVSFFFAYFVSVKCYPIVSNILIKTSIYTSLQKIIDSQFKLPQIIPGKGVSQYNIPSILSGIPFPSQLKKEVTAHLSGNIKTAAGLENLYGIISQNLAKVAIDIISMITIFILVRLILIIVKSVLKKITRLPIIKQLDRMIGATFGAFEGVMMVFITFSTVTLLSSLPSCQHFIVTVKHSLIANFFYENNFITAWLLGNINL